MQIVDVYAWRHGSIPISFPPNTSYTTWIHCARTQTLALARKRHRHKDKMRAREREKKILKNMQHLAPIGLSGNDFARMIPI